MSDSRKKYSSHSPIVRYRTGGLGLIVQYTLFSIVWDARNSKDASNSRVRSNSRNANNTRDATIAGRLSRVITSGTRDASNSGNAC